MNLLATPGRRLAVGLGIACAAVLLPVAALAAAGSPGQSTAGRSVNLVKSATAPATRCFAQATTVWMPSQGNGTAGHVYWVIEFSNTGKTTCTLYGYPGVSAVNDSGHLVGVPATHSGAKQLITIRPGGTAHVLLAVTDPGAVCAHPVNASQLRIYAPGQFVSHLVPFPVQVCPTRATLHVDAVHPNTGIPFYSIR